MTPTLKDKLYALAVCAGHCAKLGDMEKMVNCVNTMASIISDADVTKAKEIFATLDMEEDVVAVKQYIKAQMVDGPIPDIDDPFKAFPA